MLGTTDQNTQIQDLNKRFSLFVACSEQLQHTIPNSLLHTIKTTGDIQKFYETPVEVTTPLDKLQNMELPENLHVQYEYHRFHPGSRTLIFNAWPSTNMHMFYLPIFDICILKFLLLIHHYMM